MKARPQELKSRVVLHRKITADFFRLRLLCPEIARLARPGQFILLRVNELKDPFLRRPFSFSRIFPPREKRARVEDEGVLEILYQVVGRGTALLAQVPEGQRVDVLGPLGNGFWMPEGQQRAVLIGGGIGVAPLLPWAEELHPRRRTARIKGPGLPEVLVLIGGKSRERVLGVQELRRLGLEPQVATEDGTLGMRGMATDLLEQQLMTQSEGSTSIFACGPPSMLARVAQIADQFDLPCQVLLETRMACGVGACLGCAVKVREENPSGAPLPEMETPQGLSQGECGEGEMGTPQESLMPVIGQAPPFRYLRACKEGPVFDARKVLWD